MNPRRLYRCRHDRWLAGVAGGMAEYFEIDPTIVRILWILSAFLGGLTILLYIILALVMPPEPLASSPMPGYPGATGGAAGATPDGTPQEASAGSAGASAAASDAGAPAAAPGAIPGWTSPQGTSGATGWQDPAWTGHRHETAPGRGNGRAGLALGVLLVVFGSIALVGALIPAWAAIGLGPAFIVALGIALIVAATRRPAAEA